MRLLFVGVIPPHPGGAAVSLGQLLTGFAEAGCDVVVVAPITEQALLNGDDYAVQNPLIQVLRFSTPSWQYAGKQDPDPEALQAERDQVEALVSQQVDLARPDIIVAGRESFAPHVAELAERHGIKSIQFVRGLPTAVILAGEYPEEQGERLLQQFRRFDRVLCVADFLTQGLRGCGVSQVRTMPNSIRLDLFSNPPAEIELRKDLRLTDDDIVVLTPANFHWRKHPRDVVGSAVVALRDEPRLRYVMVGVGALAQETEDYCRSLGLEDCFRFPGWLTYDRMPGCYGLADIVVMASEYEGMSRAYIEAMAAGRPLIAADSLAAKELIADETNGVLYPVGDVDALAERTVRLAQDPTLRTRLAAAAEETARARSISDSVPVYISEFECLLQPS